LCNPFPGARGNTLSVLSLLVEKERG
jgi:hypothetical protein